MSPKSGCRFSEKITLNQIALDYAAATLLRFTWRSNFGNSRAGTGGL